MIEKINKINFKDETIEKPVNSEICLICDIPIDYDHCWFCDGQARDFIS